MSERDYQKIYEKLGIEVKPLSENYNPDDYGKNLISSFNVVKGVVYSANTSYSSDINGEEYVY